MEDIIDSRDVIARIEELEESVSGFEGGDAMNLSGSLYEDSKRCYEQNKEELDSLLKLAKQGEGYAADWGYGESLIRDSYFEDYARELAEDCGMTGRDMKWSFTCIDWEQAARELKMDYTAIDFDGVTYWVR